METTDSAASQPPGIPVAANVPELLDELTTLETHVPGLRQYPPQPILWTRGYRTVSIAFIESVADLIQLSLTLRELGMINEMALRRRVDYIRAIRPFRDRVSWLLKSLDFTLEMVHAEAAEEALRAYTVAQSLRPAATSDISDVAIAHARETLGRQGRKRKKKQEGE